MDAILRVINTPLLSGSVRREGIQYKIDHKRESQAVSKVSLKHWTRTRLEMHVPSALDAVLTLLYSTFHMSSELI